MAPRSRVRAGKTAAGAPAATSIDDLPVAVLARCLGHLEIKERQRLVLVSKHFAAAACSPELLREVELRCSVEGMASFVRWLARHGQHIQQLRFGPHHLVPVGKRPAMSNSLASCLPALGAAGQLEELSLSDWCGSTNWLAGLQSLRRLEVFSGQSRPLPMSPLSKLTQLEWLRVERNTSFRASMRLPPSLTWLELWDHAKIMPPQVALLPNLKHLELLADYSEDSLGALSALAGSLARLRVESGWLPPCLPTLTGLLHLELVEWRGGALELVDSALQALTQLTCLLLDHDELHPLPAALGDLARLQCLGLQSFVSTPQLPCGPMLWGLRCVAAGLRVLVDGTAALKQAAALEHVFIIDSGGDVLTQWWSPAVTDFFNWLASHPPLRRLTLDACWYQERDFDWPKVVVCLLQLLRRRPSLVVDAPGFGDGLNSFQYMLFKS